MLLHGENTALFVLYPKRNHFASWHFQRVVNVNLTGVSESWRISYEILTGDHESLSGDHVSLSSDRESLTSDDKNLSSSRESLTSSHKRSTADHKNLNGGS